MPWGEDNGNVNDAGDPLDTQCYCYCVCNFVELCFKEGFKEVIHVVEPGNVSLEKITKKLHNFNNTTTSIFRFLAWFLMCLGMFLLFSPIIALLKWIPLVGWLLGGVVAVAAGVTALIVGTATQMLTMAIAWLFYRPMFGVLLLTGVAVLITVIFTVGK